MNTRNILYLSSLLCKKDPQLGISHPNDENFPDAINTWKILLGSGHDNVSEMFAY